MNRLLVLLAGLFLTSLTQTVSAQLTNSLVRYYKMDEPAGAAEAFDEAGVLNPSLIVSPDVNNNLKINAQARKSLPSSGAIGLMGNAWDFEKNPATTVGDYDGSGGPVNGRDFLVWQRNFGTNNVLPSDPTPGTVDAADLANWQSNYGLELNDAPLVDEQGFPLSQFLDEGNSVWGAIAPTNGVFFSIWVKPESLNTGIGEESRNVIISEDDNTQDFYVRSTEGGKIEMGMEGVGEVITDNVALAVGQWTHIAGGLIVDDGFEFNNTLIIYVNGTVAKINDFASINTPDALNDLILGIQDDREDNIDEIADPTNPLRGYFARTAWDGLMDDVAFWTRELTPAEVLDIYNRGVLGMSLLDTSLLTSAVAAVPEPTALGLMGIALLGVMFQRHRKD